MMNTHKMQYMDANNAIDLSAAYSSLKEQHEELKRLAPHAKSCQVRCNNQAREITNLREQIQELEEKLEKRKVYNTKLEEEIKQLKASKEQVLMPVEGAVILQVDNKLMGCYVKQKLYQEKIEIIKQLKERHEQGDNKL